MTTESSRDPLSLGGSGASAAGSLSPTDVLGLRAEVENLRREMYRIQAERGSVMGDVPPPYYSDQGHA